MSNSIGAAIADFMYKDMCTVKPGSMRWYFEQKDKQMKPEDIAKVCHTANKALCEAYGDTSQPDWKDAPDWQKNSAINGVEFIKNNPDAGPDASHNNWLEEKKKDGWAFGPVKKPELKEHPCFVPYDRLPPEQKAKDYVFGAIVRSLLSMSDDGPYDPNRKEPASPSAANPSSIADATTITPDGKLQTDLTKLTSKPL